MTNNQLLCTGCAGTIIAAICCFTPILVIALGAGGLSAWLGGIDYVLFPVMFASMGLVAFALYLRSGNKGPSPRAVIVIAVAALSALLFWLQFRYALRISIAAIVAVAVYAIYLRAGSRPGPADDKEMIS